MPNQEINNLTIPEKILLAAIGIKGADKTFTAEDLVIASWKLFPDVFGLQGYADKYPDSNKVLSNIMGNKGLREKKWIRKVGEKKYRITEAGVDAAANLSGKQTQVSHSSGLSRERKDILLKLINSSAFDKMKHNKLDTLTFTDASSFWNISVRSNAAVLKTRLKDLEVTFSSVEKLMNESEIKTLSLTHGTNYITSYDLNNLIKLHEFMLDKFKDQLEIIKQRHDERKY